MSIEIVNARNCKELPVLEGLVEENLGASLSMLRLSELMELYFPSCKKEVECNF